MPETGNVPNESFDPFLRPEPTNAFVAFRRFADNQISSLVNLVFGPIPVSSSPYLPPRTSELSPEPKIKGSVDLKSRLQRKLNSESNRERTPYEKSYHSKENLRCPYAKGGRAELSDQDSEDLCSYLDYVAIKPDLLSILGYYKFPQLPPSATPVSLMPNSRYFPIHLEQDMFFSNCGSLWRTSFEDLVAFENEFELSRNPSSSATRAQTPGMWLWNMICRSNLATEQHTEDAEAGCQENSAMTAAALSSCMCSTTEGKNKAEENANQHHNNFFGDIRNVIRIYLEDDVSTGKHSISLESKGQEDDHHNGINPKAYGDDVYVEKENSVDEDDTSELDLYDLFLKYNTPKPSESRKSSILPQFQFSTGSRPTNETSQQSVLSILTTTEKTRLKDGTTHTRIILKKRFLDGREESTETIHTQTNLPEDSRLSRPNATQRHEMKGSESTQRKGWFWS